MVSPGDLQEVTMGIVKRDNSKFWYIQFQYNGQTYIKSSKTTDRRIAEMMESDWRKKVILQKVIGIKDRIKFLDVLSQYSDSKRDLASHHSIVFYIKIIQKYFKDSDYIDSITTQTVETFKQRQQQYGYSNQTIKHLLGAIRGTWLFAKRMGYQVSDRGHFLGDSMKECANICWLIEAESHRGEIQV